MRQGTANTKKIKVVCQRCNSGWMGTLEGDVQPLLVPLIKGTSSALDAAARQIIAEWIVMKILVAEHISYLGHPADAIFDQSARDTCSNSLGRSQMAAASGSPCSARKMDYRFSQACNWLRC
jgi:hypothetical protein